MGRVKSNVVQRTKEPIMADGSTSVIGTYEGECLDTNITNANGLDISRDVIENVLASDEYQTALKNRWYIGFLGHPSDPNCMDFKDACIVMTDMSVDSDGKVYGTFDLVDTPVGRTVKMFQDAGVVFGISIRGAGDIIDNSVDPDTFVFRGFDLVSFPAYPESVPTFTAVAASTDASEHRKYQAVCAAVRSNLADIHSLSALDVLQSQFSSRSNIYKQIEQHKATLAMTNVDAERIFAMTNLYVDELHSNSVLVTENEKLKRTVAAHEVKLNNKLKRIKTIMSSQLNDAVADRDEVCAEVAQLQNKVRSLEKSNLLYKRRAAEATAELKSKDTVISSLQASLTETVSTVEAVETRASNLDVKCRESKDKLRASERLLGEYQTAYARVFANALGVDFGSLSVNASTSVEDLQSMIMNSTNTVNLPAATTYVQPWEILEDDETESSELVVL